MLATVIILGLAAASLAQPCTLTAVGGKQYDISILQASASDGPQNSLAANWNDDEYNLNPLKDRDNYTYYFNVCEALVNTENNVEKVTVPTPTQTSVLQVTLNGKRGPHVIGTSSDSSLTSLHDGDLRFLWGPGDISRHCGNNSRQAIMIFVCASDYGTPVFADESDNCVYTFIWNTCGACPLGSPERSGCARPTAQPTGHGSEGLSGGSIVLIVFFALVATYVLVGVAYQRLVAGARGWDQLPQRAFWTACWGNAMFGCNHVFCSWRNPKPLSVRYKEMNADELELNDDNEEDEI